MRALTEFEHRPRPEQTVAEPTWSKGAPVALAPDASAETALVAALGNGLDHLAANEACVLARAHDEGVHQMRVATRRLRSRISIYRDLLSDEVRKPLERSLKWLIGRLGPARDWDVFLLETLPRATQRFEDDADLAILQAAAERMCDRGYKRAQSALRSERYTALKALLETWSGERPWRQTKADAEPEAMSVLDAPARTLAGGVLEARHGLVDELGARFGTLDPEQRHELRIDIKKLRYATEFFGSLYGGNAVSVYLGSLKRLQDSLGVANDLVVARTLMATLVDGARKKQRARMAFAAGLVAASQPDAAGREADMNGLWDAFRDAEPFWR